MSLKPTILVVDDTPDNLTLMSGLLKDDYRVKVANGGERALKIALSDTPPDLILLDVMMPEMDGYEVCRRLKDTQIPVIFLTAKSEVEDETYGLSLGAVDYITKPISPPIVLARVKNHLLLKQAQDFLRDQNAFLESEVRRRTDELVQSTLARQALESELKVALRLQRSMLPADQYHWHNFHLAAHLTPARTIGGDLYEYIALDDQRLLFAVGDVSDKGVAAALFMVRVLTLLRWLAGPDPAVLLRQLNAALARDNDACMFVTLGCGVLDRSTGEVLYASGGHEPPVFLTAGQPSRELPLAGGPALGLLEDAEFPLHRFPLGRGQGLVLVSDGVSEANDPGQQEFGTQRLLESALGTSPPQVLERCLKALEAFTAGAEAHDDLTILVLMGEA